MAIVDELNALQAETLAAIEAAQDTAALEQVRVAVTGKSGTLTGYLRSMGQVPKEERAEVGKAVNTVRNVVEAALEEKKSQLGRAELEARMEAGAVGAKAVERAAMPVLRGDRPAGNVGTRGAVSPPCLPRHHCMDIWASISSIFLMVTARSSGEVRLL